MATGSVVCQGCMCTDTAINIDGRERYDATIAQLPPPNPEEVCNCPAEFGPTCVRGVCTAGY